MVFTVSPQMRTNPAAGTLTEVLINRDPPRRDPTGCCRSLAAPPLRTGYPRAFAPLWDFEMPVQRLRPKSLLRPQTWHPRSPCSPLTRALARNLPDRSMPGEPGLCRPPRPERARPHRLRTLLPRCHADQGCADPGQHDHRYPGHIPVADHQDGLTSALPGPDGSIHAWRLCHL
jgi:hypothetical protein